MAVSNLESIAEKLDEAKKQKLEEILAVSGSNALTKNEYGITNVDDNNVASTLVFKPLNQTKFDTAQIIKSINPEVSELKPDIPVPRKDLVPKPIYDEEVKANETLRGQINILNNTIDQLNDRVNELTAQVETEVNNRLAIEQSNDVLSNQAQTLTSTIDDFASQIQNSLQKSIEESILRGSLQSQNSGFRAQIEALIKQIDSLNSIIEGLQSQLGAVQQQNAIQQSTAAVAQASGGDVINDVAVVTFSPGRSDNLKIIGRFRSGGESRFDAGAVMEITNNDTMPITVKLSVKSWPAGRGFLRIPESEFTVEPSGNKKISFGLDNGSVGDLDAKPKGGWFNGHTGSNFYGGGVLNIAVTRSSNGSTKDKDFGMGVDKKHPNSY